jgi:integrase
MLATTETTTKRERKSVILTDRMCEKRVTARTKIFDSKCPGFYVSIIPAGVATFCFKFTDPAIGKQRTVKLGLYSPDFNVAKARGEAYAKKGMDPATLVADMHQKSAAKGKHGLTISKLIALRIDFMKQLEKKEDGEMRPRIESWQNVASHLRRFIGKAFGNRYASEITRSDIAALSNEIAKGDGNGGPGTYGRPSISNARHMRRSVSGMFNWAALEGNDLVPENCRGRFDELPKLRKENPRTRVLTESEIKTFWFGLDQDDLPYDRKTRLVLKFALVTMLRSGELLPAHRDELFDLAGSQPRLDVPLKRVKKRRVISQPLSDLAVEIVNEALEENKSFVFSSPIGNQPMHRHAMATALRGRPDKSMPGLCELLGLQPFTPHDLRRSAASWARLIGQPMSKIALCLDHRMTTEDGVKLPPVTGRHYVHAEARELQEKREVLQAWASELRRIIGQPADKKLKLVA